MNPFYPSISVLADNPIKPKRPSIPPMTATKFQLYNSMKTHQLPVMAIIMNHICTSIRV